MADNEKIDRDPYLNVTHSTSWVEREGFAGILVTLAVNGEKCADHYVASLATAAKPESPRYAKFERGRNTLKDLFDRVLTWEEYKSFAG